MSAAPADRDTLREAAAWWFSERRAGDMTPEGEQRFLQWLSENPAHAEAYRRIEHHWAVLGGVAQTPEIMAAREHDLDAFDRPQRWRRLGAVAAALLLAITASWAVVDSGLLSRFGIVQSDEVLAYRTGLGQRSTFTLAEGSVVTLDTDSEVRVDAMGSERKLELVHGRAFFRVAKDPDRPFVVTAAGRSVRALGTAFAVRLDKADVTVTLVEGKVRVEQPRGLLKKDRQTELTAGRQLVARDDKVWSMGRVDVQRETSWLNGQLVFLRDPLSKAVSEMNRYSERKLVFSGGRIPDRKIVGVFKAGDVDSFVKAVELNGLAEVVSRTESEIELSAE